MDLKALLLEATSSKKPLHFCRRLQLGRSSFAVSFEVNGKMLTVTRIKQIYTQTPLNIRLHRRQRSVEKFCSTSSSGSGCSSLSSIVPPGFADCATQTSRPHMCNRTTEIDHFGFAVHREQQTTHLQHNKRSTQTHADTMCQYVQTECRVGSASVQTELNVASIPVQTDLTGAMGGCSDQVKEQSRTVVLSEIGDLVINHNHLLQKNSIILNQISELTMLRERAVLENGNMNGKANEAAPCNRQKGAGDTGDQILKVTPRRKAGLEYCRRFIKRSKSRCSEGHNVCKHFPKIPKRRKKRDQSAQTVYPIGLSHKATQTYRNFHNGNRWKLFKWMQN